MPRVAADSGNRGHRNLCQQRATCQGRADADDGIAVEGGAGDAQATAAVFALGQKAPDRLEPASRVSRYRRTSVAGICALAAASVAGVARALRAARVETPPPNDGGPG